MMRTWMLLVGLGSGAALLATAIGCGTPFIEATHDRGYSDSELEQSSDDPVVHTWQAMRIVLEEEFGPNQVKVSTYPERRNRALIVHSAMHAQGLTKQRTEVKAYVTADEYNMPVPQIYVWNQMESNRVAQPASRGLIFGQSAAQRRWVRIARNEVLEARLTNRVNEVLHGHAGFDASQPQLRAYD